MSQQTICNFCSQVIPDERGYAGVDVRVGLITKRFDLCYPCVKEAQEKIEQTNSLLPGMNLMVTVWKEINAMAGPIK